MNTRETALTIAVPFAGGIDYLRRALESIFAQPAGNWIVMFVDNSPDEDQRSQALQLLAAYPGDRIRYVRNERFVSATENFNRCIDLAQTDLVSTVHADDEVLPNYATEILSLAGRQPDAAILFVPVVIIGEDSARAFSFVDWYKTFLVPRGRGDLVLDDERSLRSLLRGDWVNGAAIAYRKSRLGDMRWDPQLPMISDLDLWSRAIVSGRFMAGSRAPAAYAYRRHSAQTTAKSTANLARFYEEARVYDLIAARAASRGWKSAQSVARAKTILKLHLLFLIARDLVARRFDALGTKVTMLGSLSKPS